MISDPLNAKCSMPLDLDSVVDVAYDTYILQWLFIPSLYWSARTFMWVKQEWFTWLLGLLMFSVGHLVEFQLPLPNNCLSNNGLEPTWVTVSGCHGCPLFPRSYHQCGGFSQQHEELACGGVFPQSYTDTRHHFFCKVMNLSLFAGCFFLDTLYLCIKRTTSSV